ncbi:asparagine synthase (glutamine-hydrolyzing) [Patescibacteria group bacterium]|jgi:asparagine synthase (glutamine-hydrolysing)|nr:asparagine synthase (glutamine-hydrolyzing) [Patescibacteria group bacterium]
MCGIAGLVSRDGRPVDRDRLVGMVGAIRRRGPDGEGIWTEGAAGLGHRRLAIVDLSDGGKQPMRSADGRFSITFNGEIYNYQELRKQLADNGEPFHSTSDTEVLLKLYERNGEAMLEKLRGMFAFAIWDKQKNELFFARDRVGKKPFFWMNDAAGFAFASEVTALTSNRKIEIDEEALRLFIGLQYVPAPRTGFRGINSLPPAHCGTWKDSTVSIRRYDSFEALPAFSGRFEEAVRETRRLLEDAVRYRLIADVEVGCFLSGGMDSTAVAALMAKMSASPIKTFTMGFPNWAADERSEAESFAKRIGAQHISFEANPKDGLALVDDLIELYGVPYADSSSLPTYLLARETRKHVKAVMNGDGGDEAFGGYRRYGYFKKAERLHRMGLGSVVAGLSRMLKSPRYGRFADTLDGLRASVADGYAELFTGSYFNREAASKLLQPEFASKTAGDSAESFIRSHFDPRLRIGGALDFDRRSYLPDDLCVKMDRATMAHGLEARSPFLDQELMRFTAHLPFDFHFRGGKQKAVLQAAIADLVPAEVLSRPKRGFQVPLAAWFRSDLRSAFVERCLSSDAKLLEICRKEEVERYLHENDRGLDHGNRLWMLLSLATWLEKYG